jgi:ubiquinone/menaquinone biosynthesis C-methylase UbiE
MLTETEFYDKLAQAYDVMNDWPARLAAELPFIERLLAETNARDVLDCACGTGQHAIALARRGLNLSASDASPAMVARAQQNARSANVSVPFLVAKFSELDTIFQQRFDAVLCLGNSLPHVTYEKDARSSLAAIRNVLRPGGTLVMQNLNYDKRWKDRPRWFAVNHGRVDDRETLVWRFADYGEALITFNIALFTRRPEANWSVDVQSTLQKPYQRDELASLLASSGFDDLAYYGDLKNAPYDPASSGDLVIVARPR